MSFEARKINAARLCYGLANIGYKSYAAIEDIIDNSVEANAKKILIKVEVEANKTLIEKGSISRITIIDNGNGMDKDSMSKALDIGSDVNYNDHSLSKYGLGLKSAGLSLGNRIQVYSKKNGSYSKCHTLDMEIISKKNEYGVLVEDLSEQKKNNFFPDKSGTIIEISEISNYDTVNSLKKRLIDRLGVIYYEFIRSDNDERNIEITLNIGNKSHTITEKDILFSEDSDSFFDEQKYDCKTPCKLLINQEIVVPNSPSNTPPIKLSLTVFPQKNMEKFPGFNDDEKDKIKSYDVSLSNSGFFIYRNNRLIRWGDNLGIVDRDLRTLRGRIDIYSEHDELLNVDVSKQNLELPEEFLDNLSLLCRIPKDNALKAFKLCKQALDHNDDKEGEIASNSVLDIYEEDPDYITKTPEEQKESIERKNKILIESNSIESIHEEKVEEQDQSSVNIHKIVYKDFLLTTNLWQSRLDPEYGTIVQINKSHPFYQLVLKSLDAASPKRQAIECFIYCLSVGENNTRQNLSKVDYDSIKIVMEKYNQVVSYHLQNWTAHNQDLFD